MKKLKLRFLFFELLYLKKKLTKTLFLKLYTIVTTNRPEKPNTKLLLFFFVNVFSYILFVCIEKCKKSCCFYPYNPMSKVDVFIFQTRISDFFQWQAFCTSFVQKKGCTSPASLNMVGFVSQLSWSLDLHANLRIRSTASFLDRSGYHVLVYRASFFTT